MRKAFVKSQRSPADGQAKARINLFLGLSDSLPVKAFIRGYRTEQPI